MARGKRPVHRRDPWRGDPALGPPGKMTPKPGEVSEDSRAEPAPRLVSWNGNGFDLPVIRYRSLLHGIPAPGFYRTDGEWKWNNYQGRFHDMHVDLMDVLSGYGASYRVGLGTLSRLIGLPEKEIIQDPIYEHILRGEEGLVAKYCKLDCLDTLLL